MLKTFTILATVPARATATSLEAAMRSGILATFGTNDDDVRVDAFEGEHTSDALMNKQQREVLPAVRLSHIAMRTPPKPRTWAELSRDEQARVLLEAREHGGGFVTTLVAAWNLADGGNAAKLGASFGAMLLEHYGYALKED